MRDFGKRGAEEHGAKIALGERWIHTEELKKRR